MSDFGLNDAIESGLVKTPRVVIRDDGKLASDYKYNEDDCRSAALLRDWLEGERKKLEDGGTAIPRPAIGDGAPSEELDERQKRVAALVVQLVDGVPLNPMERSDEQEARWMLAQLLDWHRRENKASWWEGYRLADLDDEELLDERVALAGLRFVAGGGGAPDTRRSLCF